VVNPDDPFYFSCFNYLFEIPNTGQPRQTTTNKQPSFNSLFEMLGVLEFCLCGFLSVSVVVSEVCRGVFCVGFVGVV